MAQRSRNGFRVYTDPNQPHASRVARTKERLAKQAADIEAGKVNPDPAAREALRGYPRKLLGTQNDYVLGATTMSSTADAATTLAYHVI